MPQISSFFGIVIYMYLADHNPPHFHAIYGEYKALIDIQTLGVIGGKLPKRAHALVIEWANEHQNELMANWQRMLDKQQFEKIDGLE